MTLVKKLAIWLILLAVVVSFAVYVWPTRYEYDHTNIKGIGFQPVRIDRFNGQTEILYPDGWKRPIKKPKPTVAEQIPYIDLMKIDGRAGIKGNIPNAQYVANIYNGSNWKITEITVELSYKKSSRNYRLVGYVEPLSSANISTSIDTGIQLEIEKNKENPDWSLVSAKGYPPPRTKAKTGTTLEDLYGKDSYRSRMPTLDDAIAQIKAKRGQSVNAIAWAGIGGIVVLGSTAVFIQKRRKKKSSSESTQDN